MTPRTAGPGLVDLSRAMNQFDELDAGIRTNLFELKSTYGQSALRDVVTSTGSGSVTHTGPEFRLDTTADGSDFVALSSAEAGRYVPGRIAEPGVAVRIPDATPSGSEVFRWGYMNEDGAGDGFYFGLDSGGIFVARRRSGSEDTKVYQANWNRDTLDGSSDGDNPSALSLDLTAGYVFRIPFAWYGYGGARWQVLVKDQQGTMQLITVHEEKVDGETSLENPNVPVTVEIDNGGTATAHQAFVAGRQFAVRGPYDPNRRVTGELVTGASVGASLEPILSVRRKANVGSGAFFESASVKVSSLLVSTDQDIEIVILNNASLTAPSWGSFARVSDAETALEVDTSATGLTGGEYIDSGIVIGGQGSQESLGGVDVFDFDLIRRQPLVIAARNLGSAATADVLARFREEW